MSRFVNGWVVSRQSNNILGAHWQAWRSGETRLVADTYRGLLAMIRESNA